MSIQLIKGHGAASPEVFKKKYPGHLVTAHPYPRLHTAFLKAEGDDALILLKGQVKVTFGGQNFEMNVGDQLLIKDTGQIVIETITDVGSFLLKANYVAPKQEKAL